MAHRIYSGSFAALEVRFLAEIERIQKDDVLCPVSILVGSNVLASYLRHRLGGRGRPAANLRFFTFLDLVTHLSVGVGEKSSRPRLPQLGPSLILDAILQAGTPPVFDGVAAYPGFRHALLDTFRDLRDAGIAPEDFAAAIRALSQDRGNRREDLAALSDLFRRYRIQVQRFRDVDDDFRAAIDNLTRSKARSPGTHLLVYGIYDVTGQQGEILNALKHAAEMIYFIPFVDEDSTGFSRPFLESCRGQLGVEVERLPFTEGSQLFGRLFAKTAPSGPLRADGTFVLVSAPGASRAAVEIVREIFGAIRDGTISGFQDAAVVVRHAEEEIPGIAEALRLRDVPYYVHGGVRFSTRPLSRAVISIAALEPQSFARLPVFRAMELVAAALPPEKAKAWEVSNWRALTRDLPFLQGIDRWDAAIEGLIRHWQRKFRELEGSPLPLPENLEEEQESILSPEQSKRRIESAEGLRNGWSILRAAADGWPKEGSWSEWADLLGERLSPLLAESEDWEAFSAILDDLRSLHIVPTITGQPTSVSRSRMVAALEQSLNNSTYPQGRFLRSGVNILPLSAARGLRFPLVIVPGLDEGRFPARLREDPFLLDAERRGVGSPGRLPLKRQRIEEEKLLFDMALRSAERRVVLLTSRLDESSDRESLPSDFFFRAATGAGGGRVRLRDLTPDRVPGLRSVSLEDPAPAESSVAVDRAEVRLRLITRDPHPSRALKELANLEPLLLKRPLEFDSARWQHRLTPFDGRIQHPDLVRWVARNHGPGAGQMSASRIEDYARCPYYFFLKRVMSLENWEEVDDLERLEPLVRGKVIHAILEDFLSQLPRDALESRALEDLDARLRARARSMLDSHRSPGLPDLLWEIERDSLLTLLSEWLRVEKNRAGEGLRPALFERSFGALSPGNPAPGYRIQTGRHTFEFRGRIDRVDVSENGTRARVIDYKTGTLPRTIARRNANPLMAGERVQLLVYRGALSLVPEYSSIVNVDGEYLHLQPKDGRAIPRTFGAEEMKNAQDRFSEILNVIGDGIEEGVFFHRTTGRVRPEGHCGYCDYVNICGKDRARVEERKAGDPAVRRFEAVNGIDDLGEGAEEVEE